MLLDVEVAREPGEVVPVPHLVGHLGHPRQPGLGPPAAPVVVGEQGVDFPRRTLVEPADGLAEPVVRPEAEPRDDREPLRLRQPAGLQDRPDPRGVDGHRLLGEDVLAGLDRHLELDRPELGRRAEQDHVDARGDELLAGVEAHEPPRFGDVDLGPDLGIPLEEREALGEAVLEGVGQGHELDVGVGRQGLRGGAGPPAPAADQADAEGLAAGRVDRRQGGQGPDGGGGPDDFAAGDWWMHRRDVLRRIRGSGATRTCGRTARILRSATGSCRRGGSRRGTRSPGPR